MAKSSAKAVAVEQAETVSEDTVSTAENLPNQTETEKVLSDTTVHFLLAAKGGIGKTYIGSLLLQLARRNGAQYIGLDLDQSNAMLAAKKGLDAERINLETDAVFDGSKLDKLMHRIMENPAQYVIDMGASTYKPVWEYLTLHGYLDGLRSLGIRVVIHSVVTGGGDMAYTLNNCVETCQYANDGEVILWLNDAKGRVEVGERRLTEFPVYKQIESKIAGIVTVVAPDPVTLKDIDILTQEGLTLSSVDDSKLLQFFPKHRIKTYAGRVFTELDKIWGPIHGQPA